MKIILGAISAFFWLSAGCIWCARKFGPLSVFTFTSILIGSVAYFGFLSLFLAIPLAFVVVAICRIAYSLTAQRA